jgi:hypothetical protein
MNQLDFRGRAAIVTGAAQGTRCSIFPAAGRFIDPSLLILVR